MESSPRSDKPKTITVTSEGGPITIDVGNSDVVTIRLEIASQEQGSYIRTARL